MYRCWEAIPDAHPLRALGDARVRIVSRTRRGHFMSSRCGGVAAAVREINLLAEQVGTSRGAWCCERLAFLEAARSAPRRTNALRRHSPHSLRAAETFRDETAPVDKAQAGAWDNVP